MNKISIKKATKKDVNDILELANLMLDFHHRIDPYYTIYSKYEDSKEFYRKQLGRKGVRFVLVVDSSGKNIGFGHASITSIPKTRAPKLGKLIAIFVKKKYRNKGIGSKIFRDLMQWLEKSNVKHVELHVDSRNRKTILLWKKLGFKDYQINL